MGRGIQEDRLFFAAALAAGDALAAAAPGRTVPHEEEKEVW
jgi:predicted transcriptional regulator